jgi:uncharacterized protein (TIGR03067 family)
MFQIEWPAKLLLFLEEVLTMHAILLLALAAPLAADPDETKSDKTKLQGVWKVTAVESRGAALPGDRLNTDRYTLVIVGDDYVLLTHAGTVTFDRDKKTLDMKITDGRYKGRDLTLKGLYELTDDTLKIAIPSPAARGSDRPLELKTGENTTHTLYTFERDKKAKKEDAEAKLKELKTALPDGPQGFTPRTTTDRTTQELLKQIIERLDRIEKRLDAIEKKAPEKT